MKETVGHTLALEDEDCEKEIKALYPIFLRSDALWNGNHNDWETFYENLELITWYNKVTK